MIDLYLLRKHPELLTQAIQAKKQKPVDIPRLAQLDELKRTKIAQVDTLHQQRNQKNREFVQQLQQHEQTSPPLREEMNLLAEQIKQLQQEIDTLDQEIQQLLLWIPNLPAPEVPKGDETQNILVRTWGKLPTFAFDPKPHWELGALHDILDIERGSRMSGSGFPILKGKGASLQRALIQFMLDLHIQQHGYLEVAPPHLIHRAPLEATGQLPKLEEDMYHLDKEDLFLIPTAEVPLINLYREEIIEEEKLPIKLVAESACFRREAGSHGKDTRGLLRIHEFKKVELIKFVRQENSYQELEQLLQEAESVLKWLEIPYRVVLLATEEMSFASAKTYDIEVWAPGIQRWLEVSSCSNCTDFQARRANMRYKKGTEKPRFLHLLNASGVALPRLIAAILENGQQENGHIRLPSALYPYLQRFGFHEI